MAKWISRIILVGNCALLLILLYRFGLNGVMVPGPDFEYKDFVVILLTAIAVLLGVATVFVAGLAVWGYTAIREAAERRAEEAARAIASDVAQAVALRETPNAVRLYFAVNGQVSAGATENDELAKALKTGDGEGGGK